MEAGDDHSGGSGLSNNDVAASGEGTRSVPDHRVRDHDSDKKFKMEGAFGGGGCLLLSMSCSEQGWSVGLVQGKVLRYV